VIGAVGRLERQKRFDLLIHAFDQLRPDHPRLRLVIAGEGSLRQQLELQRTQLGIADSVLLPGHVSDVVSLHHAFDLFVQSSDYEGTPNSVLEAMALETPLVATDVGGTAELVRSDVDGVVVPPGRVEPIVQAVSALLASPSRARDMAVQARARVETDLSFETRMKRVEAIYEDLAGKRSRCCVRA
jgi:glycosyltransferase involved in cell wall biosynthesis